MVLVVCGMKNRGAQGIGLVCCWIFPLLVACEDGKPSSAEKPASTATVAAAPAASAPPVPAAPTAPAPTAKSNERPSKIDTALTPARRSAVEAKYGAAKGFLVASELETKLKSDKSLKDKKAAIAAFDKAARGKWVLFTGPLVNLTDDGFDVGFEYSPQLPNDPMGMSRQFFEVTLSQVEGYSKDAFKAGNMVVVLAKYNGAGKGGPGYELVSTGAWD
jgi:hypothetical protein